MSAKAQRRTPRPVGRQARGATALLLAALAGLLLSLLSPLGSAQAAPAPAPAAVTITNGTQFTDPNGDVVHAHGGGVIKVEGYYYWFGENRNEDNTFRYVSAYRSTDLKTWEFRKNVLTQKTDPELESANIERPKVIYNKATDTFVMWMHKENASDYGEARAAVAVSSTVDGDYAWRGSFRPLDHMSRDITTFVDDDGTGYMISAANENADLHVYRLSGDYTKVDSLVRKLWEGRSREAPAMFKRDGRYFLLTSGATGWSPNQQKYSSAESITGDWTELNDIGNGKAYGSQTAYVLPVQGTSGTSYLYMGDRWGNSMGGNVNDSPYVWLPLDFPTKGTMTMDYYPQISVDAEAGKVSGTGSWETLAAEHSGKCADIADESLGDGATAVQWSCSRGSLNQQFWFQDSGDGTVRAMLRHSGKCLDVRDASTEDGAAVVQSACGEGDSQRWTVRNATGGGVHLVARHSGKCLDVQNRSTGDGAPLIQWACDGEATNQRWERAGS
ncbi:RICIN domain-containing protein [Streptomyces sp. NPDC058257]|uniref:RICIN domain-containing protein n=1 Tax=Streptomyces sp. NPDC058257 TaxID=3346409 RepID=UPI0036EBBC12